MSEVDDYAYISYLVAHGYTEADARELLKETKLRDWRLDLPQPEPQEANQKGVE